MLAPASEVPHEFTDKYLLTELLANLAISSTAVTLESLGLTPAYQAAVLSWIHDDKREVMLGFTLDPRCLFLREETREISEEKSIEEEKNMSVFFHPSISLVCSCSI